MNVADRLLAPILGLGLLSVGCQKAEESEAPGWSASSSAPESEMVLLAPKAQPREPRRVAWLPENSSSDSRATEIPAGKVTLSGRGDVWDTEERSVEAMERLKELFDSPQQAEGVLAEDVRADALPPQPLSQSKVSGTVLVRRWDRGNVTAERSSIVGRGAVIAMLSDWLGQYQADTVRVEWKPVGIELAAEDAFVTRVFAEISGHHNGKRLEAHAEWRGHWAVREELELLKLELLKWHEVSDEGGPWFEDVTASVLAGVPLAKDQMATGIEYWCQRITRYGDLYQTGHHGLAIADVNGDGLEDLYVCDGGSLPNRLYVQQPDGSVQDQSAEAGVDFLEDSRGALLVDLDEDGDVDLVVATVAMIAFAENDGSGRFTLRGGHMGAPYPGSLSAADPDSDGDLDIYVCVYESNHAGGAQGFQARTPVPFHDAQNGGRNLLLENLGGFEFVDHTEAFGLDDGNSRWSFAAAWEDVDRDGDPDLYVANDFGRNQYYRNEGGRFTEVAAEADVEDMAAGMSVAWGDPNRDGHADLYVGNMFSSAGQRISYQRRFASEQGQERDAAALAGKQRMARGNTLFVGGAGGERFEDVSEKAGVTMGRWAWSSAFVDINLDGWEDLVVANGYMSNRREDDL